MEQDIVPDKSVWRNEMATYDGFVPRKRFKWNKNETKYKASGQPKSGPIGIPTSFYTAGLHTG